MRKAMIAAPEFAWFTLGANPPGFRGRTERLACTVLETSAAETGGGSSFTCVTDGGIVLSAQVRESVPAAGIRVLLRGRVEPFDGPRNPGEPDERQIQAERGVSGRVEQAQILSVLPRARLTPLIALACMHAWALRQLELRVGEPFASILGGELWGARGSLPPELHAEFQQTGTVHILVTAGLHLGVVCMAMTMLLRLLTVPRAPACAIAIAAVWLYAVFSGLHLPSMRAAIMISFGLAAHAMGLSARSWRAYAVAALGVALLRPESVTSASYGLSFSCVGAILLCADEIHEMLSRSALPERVKEALTLTIATQLGTWPLTAAIFLIFSPYAVFANLCVVPLVAATMMLGAAQLLLSAMPFAAQLVANVNAWILMWTVCVIHSIATLPYASVPVTPPPAWAIAIYDGSLVIAVCCWKRRAATPALAALLLGIAVVSVPPVDPNRNLRITVLDVGQADGIVIQTPAGHTILVDAGGKLERGGGGLQSSSEAAGERIVVPFLRRSGIRRIDALILSHPHGDHAGAMAPIMRDGFRVGEFADSGQQYRGYAYRDAVATARAERVPILYPRAGMTWKTEDGVTLTFIGPSLPFIESGNTINDNSIAFVLQYRHFRMLFTGDAGIAAEQRFLSEGIDLHADVLKVGHHGSAYSSSPAFIDAVHPAYAIISVGRHNMFGHPAPATIETLRRIGAQIYRTDENGAGMIRTDGYSVNVSAMLR